MFEDLVFSITEKTAPISFLRFEFLHVLPVSRAQTAGEMHDLVMVVMTVRGMAAVLSSDLTQCLGSLPGREC